MAYVKVFMKNGTVHTTQINNKVGAATLSTWCLDIGGRGLVVFRDNGTCWPQLEINVRQLSRDEFNKLRSTFRGYWSDAKDHKDYSALTRHPAYKFRHSVDKYDSANNFSWLLERSIDCWERKQNDR